MITTRLTAATKPTPSIDTESSPASRLVSRKWWGPAASVRRNSEGMQNWLPRTETHAHAAHQGGLDHLAAVPPCVSESPEESPSPVLVRGAASSPEPVASPSAVLELAASLAAVSSVVTELEPLALPGWAPLPPLSRRLQTAGGADEEQGERASRGPLRPHAEADAHPVSHRLRRVTRGPCGEARPRAGRSRATGRVALGPR